MTALARTTLACATLFAITTTTPGCAPGHAASHTAAPMVTDRPDFTESASTVVPGRIQVEAGYTFTGGESATRHEIGEVLARIGVVESSELRVGLGSYGIEHPAAAPITRGISGTSVGFKVRLPTYHLADEAALLATTTVPLATTADDGSWTPSAVLAAAWETGSTDLGANLGYVYTGTPSGTGELLASLAAGIPVNDRVGFFVELYGHLPAGGSVRAAADAGLTLAVSPDLQLDVRVGRTVVGGGKTVVGIGLAARR